MHELYRIAEKYPEIVELLSNDNAIQKLHFNSGLLGIKDYLMKNLKKSENQDKNASINGWYLRVSSTIL